MDKRMLKKEMVVAVILLFIGLAFTPSINANISKASIDNELVEFTTEVCGLKAGKHNVQLTREEAEEVENLIDDIKIRLDGVETREETVEIFNEAVVELDKYGLLGGLNVKQAQKLITRGFQNKRMSQFLVNIIPRFLGLSDFENIFCLLFVAITQSHWIIGEINMPFFILLFLNFTELPLGMLLYFYWRIGGIRVFDIIIEIFSIYSKTDTLNYYSLGLLGIKTGEINSNRNLRIFGFTGLIIKYNIDGFLLSSNAILLGTSFAFKSYRPQQYP
jgi:hypothetical protein